MSSERQAGLDQLLERRVPVVRIGVQRLREEILFQVVRQFLAVGQGAVTGVEGFGEQQQSTKAVTIFIEVSLVGELVLVLLPLVGPNVLHLVAGFAAF